MPNSPDILLLQLFFIFVWAKIFGEVFERLSLPAVVGEILAGVVLGPYATRFITPSETVHSIAEIGAIFLLFSVGLETRPHDLLRVGRQALRVAAAGVAIPFALGFGYMMVRHHPTHESVFVAAAMVATSVGVTARVLGDLDLLQTRAARIILAAAVFDDILGMLVLALVTGLVSVGGVKWWTLVVLLIEAAAFAVFMIVVAPRIIGRMRPAMKRISTRNAPLILSFAICLGLSVAAEKIGMAAIIGAFFAGLAIAEYSPEWDLHPRVSAITEFLAPYFFFTMGARLNLHIFTGDVIFAAVMITFLAIISKVGGCGLVVLNEGRQTALRVGVGMTPRGEVGLIVALVGLQMKIISDAAYAIVVFMTGVTTILAPPVLRYLFRKRAPEAAAAAE
jgi:Kef-type K+ transport system membrane component KefB